MLCNSGNGWQIRKEGHANVSLFASDWISHAVIRWFLGDLHVHDVQITKEPPNYRMG